MKKRLLPILAIFLLAACQNQPSHPADATETEAPQSGELSCYQLTETDQGIQAVTFISLRIDLESGKVSGEQAIEMTGSEYNAVAAGTLDGRLVGDVITVDYTYEIEGSQQVEEQEFRLETDRLLINNGELEERDGKLVLKKKGVFNLAIPKIACP